MRINFLLIFSNTSVNYQIYFKTTLAIFVSHDFQHEILHSFGIGSPMHLKLNRYVRITLQENSSFAPKDSLL
jgi:hypothetical protein